MTGLRRSCAVAAKHNIETKANCEFRFGCRPIKCCDQTRTGGRVLNAFENRIKDKQRVAWKVHLRNEPGENAGSKKRKVNMRGTPCVFVISPRVCAGLYGNKAIVALVVGEHAAASRKVRIERSVMI